MLLCRASPEAAAVWHWWNFVASLVPEGMALSRINMDEASLRLSQGDGKGTVFLSQDADVSDKRASTEDESR